MTSLVAAAPSSLATLNATLATFNAVLNAGAALLLVAGWMFIRRGDVRKHRAAMVAAFAVSAVFLVSYLTRATIGGTHSFRGPAAVKPLYFAILGTHVPLAALVPVLALRMFFLAWKGRFDAHRRLGRITLPIWLYVSVTGVLVYLMLYRWFTGPEAGVAGGL